MLLVCLLSFGPRVRLRGFRIFGGFNRGRSERLALEGWREIHLDLLRPWRLRVQGLMLRHSDV